MRENWSPFNCQGNTPVAKCICPLTIYGPWELFRSLPLSLSSTKGNSLEMKIYRFRGQGAIQKITRRSLLSRQQIPSSAQTNPMATIGSRLSIASFLCTVLYIGPVKDTSGTWLGVEWDDPSRGKHSGTHNSVQYFSTR